MNIQTARVALQAALRHMQLKHGGAQPGSPHQLLTAQIEAALASVPPARIPFKCSIDLWLSSNPNLALCKPCFGAPNSEGYGTLRFDNKNIKQHRYAFEHYYKAKIPQGWELRNMGCSRSCINPTHWASMPKERSDPRRGNRR